MKKLLTRITTLCLALLLAAPILTGWLTQNGLDKQGDSEEISPYIYEEKIKIK